MDRQGTPERVDLEVVDFFLKAIISSLTLLPAITWDSLAAVVTDESFLGLLSRRSPPTVSSDVHVTSNAQKACD